MLLCLFGQIGMKTNIMMNAIQPLHLQKINIPKTKECLFYEGFIKVFNKICRATHENCICLANVTVQNCTLAVGATQSRQLQQSNVVDNWLMTKGQIASRTLQLCFRGETEYVQSNENGEHFKIFPSGLR